MTSLNLIITIRKRVSLNWNNKTVIGWKLLCCGRSFYLRTISGALVLFWFLYYCKIEFVILDVYLSKQWLLCTIKTTFKFANLILPEWQWSLKMLISCLKLHARNIYKYIPPSPVQTFVSVICNMSYVI